MKAFRNTMYVLAAAATLYCLSAMVGSFTSHNSQGGCERANLSRQELFADNARSIRTNTAISDALWRGPNAAGVRDALAVDSAKRMAAIDRLTIGDYPDQPWKVNCEEAYPNPLPWPS